MAFPSISQQHVFIDHAKEFDWDEVERQIKANPTLVNVQPCGREGVKRWSALHQAAFSGNVSAVEFLLAYKADVEATTSDGRTPLDVAKNEAVKIALLSCATQANSRKVPTPLREGSLGSKASKAMKAPKGMKAMKAMKVKKVSNIAKGKSAKMSVYKGKKVKTVGGLMKEHLMRSKSGKIVSKRLHSHGTKSYANIKSWVEAFLQARSELQLTGFVAIKKGSPLYAKTMEIYRESAHR
eukprot:TRINITY_DN18071_c0_g1_i1.p1 TRINITY_DN18071_c0_g1~~TRINITY_DN18071_c0_g1_i1.p1  ORF type:complete len:239 (-),score=46.43 TRINITY_DN18071_c0_g1_i1:118-834(-)